MKRWRVVGGVHRAWDVTPDAGSVKGPTNLETRDSHESHADFFAAVEQIGWAHGMRPRSAPDYVGALCTADGVKRAVTIAKAGRVAIFAGFADSELVGCASRDTLRRVLSASFHDRCGAFQVAEAGEFSCLIYVIRWPIASLSESLIVRFIQMAAAGASRGDVILEGA